MIYCVPLLLIIYGIIQYDLRNVSYKATKYRNLEKIVFLCLVLIPGLSYRIGIDTPSYMYDYELMPNLTQFSWSYVLNEKHEPLWIIFSMLCKSISNNFAFMHTLQCFIVTISIYYVIHSFTTRHFIPLILWLTICWIHVYFEALRESLAVSMYLIGVVKLLKKDSLLGYLLWCLLAMLFHKFAFILVATTLAMYFLKSNKYLGILIFGVMIALIMFSWDTFLNNIIQMSSEDTGERIQFYLEQASTDRKASLIGILSYTIELVLPSIMMLYIFKEYSQKTEAITNLQYFLYGVIIIASISVYIEAFRRLYYYMLPIIGVAFAKISFDISLDRNLYKKCKGAFRCIVFVFIYTVAISCYRFYQPTSLEYRSNIHYNVFYLPYHSILTNEVDATREAIHRF